MTQVIQHDYGKGRVTLLQIRAAIKEVKNAKSASYPSTAGKPPEFPKNPGTKRGLGTASDHELKLPPAS